jgi:hypothetical protein
VLFATGKFLINFIIFTGCIGLACSAAQQTLQPAAAQQIVVDIWHTQHHITWEIDWPTAPVGGPLTVETWRAGNRYRFEILEAVAPALKGEVLAFDGQNGWRYNRFDPPASFRPGLASLSPVSDAFLIIERLLDTPAKTASQETSSVNYTPAQKIELAFANEDKLSLWWDQKTGLPVQISFASNGQRATLQARSFEALTDPSEALFSAGAWTQTTR